MRGKIKNNKVDAYLKTDALLKRVGFTLLQKTTCKIPHLFLGASLTSTVASSEDHQEVFVLELLRKERKHQQFL